MAQNIKVSGQMMKRKDMVKRDGQMVRFTKANILKIFAMAKVLWYIQMEVSTRVIGKMTGEKDLEQSYSKTVLDIKVFG